jgi:diketogulonate reductase-like aldo/keto reductase
MEFPHAAMIYGSAWKGDSTSDLVLQALTAGFSSVDTAAESKNYREDLVGRGVRLYLKREHDIRDRIFVCLAREHVRRFVDEYKSSRPSLHPTRAY